MGKFPIMCLGCEKEFMGYKLDYELSKPRQCFRCWSVDLIPVSEIKEMGALVDLKMVRGETMIVLDTLEVVFDYMKKKGYNFRARSMINLIGLVLRNAFERQRERIS